MKRHGLDSLVGLVREKEKARREIAASLRSGSVFPHCLLVSVGGLGKTSFARAISEELNYRFIEKEGSAFRNRAQVIDLLVEASAQGRFLLFVDEVHQLSRELQEAFYYPMSDWKITTAEKTFPLTPFCLMAATTRRDLLDERSFVARFPNVWEIERYHLVYMSEIVAHILTEMGIDFGPKEVESIARRCLGIPRQAQSLCMKIRSQVLARGGSMRVSMFDIERVMDLEGIDRIGLSRKHLLYLRQLLESGVHPVGLRSLAGRLGDHEDVVKNHIEPVLLSLGFVSMLPRGRVLTELGRKHLS